MVQLGQSPRQPSAGGGFSVDKNTPQIVPLALVSQQDVRRAIDGVRGEILPPAEQRPPRVRSKNSTMSRRVIILLTPEEHDRLQGAAARSKRSASDLVRQVLKNDGSI